MKPDVIVNKDHVLIEGNLKINGSITSNENYMYGQQEEPTDRYIRELALEQALRHFSNNEQWKSLHTAREVVEIAKIFENYLK